MKKTKTKAEIQKEKITLRERRLIKAFADNPGISIAEAGRQAGFAEKSLISYIYRKVEKGSVKNAIAEIMEKQGLTDDKLMQTLKDGLIADKVISYNVVANDGEGMKDANSLTKDLIDVPDHPTRHKFLDTALKLKNHYPSTKVELEKKETFDGEIKITHEYLTEK